MGANYRKVVAKARFCQDSVTELQPSISQVQARSRVQVPAKSQPIGLTVGGVPTLGAKGAHKIV